MRRVLSGVFHVLRPRFPRAAQRARRPAPPRPPQLVVLRFACRTPRLASSLLRRGVLGHGLRGGEEGRGEEGAQARARGTGQAPQAGSEDERARARAPGRELALRDSPWCPRTRRAWTAGVATGEGTCGDGRQLFAASDDALRVRLSAPIRGRRERWRQGRRRRRRASRASTGAGARTRARSTRQLAGKQQAHGRLHLAARQRLLLGVARQAHGLVGLRGGRRRGRMAAEGQLSECARAARVKDARARSRARRASRRTRRSNVSFTNEFMIDMAFLEMPVSAGSMWTRANGCSRAQ